MVDDSDIRILIGLARIAPSTDALVPDWADVERRASHAGRLEPPGPARPVPVAARRRLATSDSLGWGTRPLRASVAATARRACEPAVSEFCGWGTRSL